MMDSKVKSLFDNSNNQIKHGNYDEKRHLNKFSKIKRNSVVVEKSINSNL